MFRVLLVFVLALLVALPHGICFCQYAEAVPPCFEPTCCESEAPPADNHEDHDADCSCKLRESLAAGPAPVDAQRDDCVSFAAFPAAHEFNGTSINDPACFGQMRVLAGPVPLILCALRI